MNRPLRFKAWDTKRKEWIANGEVMDLNYSARCNSFMFDNDNYDLGRGVDLVQSTGLKDKSGVEIFEGDLLTSEITYVFEQEDIVSRPCVVVWAEDRATWALELNNRRATLASYMDGWKSSVFSVIGNIYEHGHLLESKHDLS